MSSDMSAELMQTEAAAVMADPGTTDASLTDAAAETLPRDDQDESPRIENAIHVIDSGSAPQHSSPANSDVKQSFLTAVSSAMLMFTPRGAHNGHVAGVEDQQSASSSVWSSLQYIIPGTSFQSVSQPTSDKSTAVEQDDMDEELCNDRELSIVLADKEQKQAGQPGAREAGHVFLISAFLLLIL
jgi:hypothetical protein